MHHTCADGSQPKPRRRQAGTGGKQVRQRKETHRRRRTDTGTQFITNPPRQAKPVCPLLHPKIPALLRDALPAAHTGIKRTSDVALWLRQRSPQLSAQRRTQVPPLLLILLLLRGRGARRLHRGRLIRLRQRLLRVVLLERVLRHAARESRALKTQLGGQAQKHNTVCALAQH